MFTGKSLKSSESVTSYSKLKRLYMYLWKTYVKNNFTFYQEQKKSISLFRVVIKSLPSEESFGPKLIKTLFNGNSAKYEGKKKPKFITF